MQTLDGAATWSLSDGELREAVAGLFARLQGVEAGWLGLVRDLDTRPDAVPGARAGEVAKTFLVHRLRRTPAQAGRDVRVAHAIDPAGEVLPTLGAAFTAGQVSREHVDVAVAARRDIPKTDARPRRRDHRQVRRRGSMRNSPPTPAPTTPRSAQALAGHLLAVLDPDRQDRFDPDAYQRRRLTSVRDSTGMLVGRFQLEPAGAAIFTAAIDRFAAPTPATTTTTEDGQQVLLGDERTGEQRRADALVTLSRIALTPTPPAPPPAPPPTSASSPPPNTSPPPTSRSCPTRTGHPDQPRRGDVSTRTRALSPWRRALSPSRCLGRVVAWRSGRPRSGRPSACRPVRSAPGPWPGWPATRSCKPSSPPPPAPC